jgi:hypothetical protein
MLWLSFGQIFWRINHTTSNKLSRSHPNATCLFYHYNVPVQRNWYSDSLRTGRRWRRDFPHPSRPALGPSSLPYIGYRVSFAVVKRLWRGVDHPPTPSTEVKKEHSYTSSPLCAANCMLQVTLRISVYQRSLRLLSMQWVHITRALCLYVHGVYVIRAVVLGH